MARTKMTARPPFGRLLNNRNVRVKPPKHVEMNDPQSLNKAIQFRHLIARLTNAERTEFMLNLLDSHVDLIITALFKQLSQSSQIEDVSRFNVTLSDIIQSRKEKPKPISPVNIKLDEFPKVIIGHFASFLHQSDYIKFSMSNRCIYLGCNTPNALQRLSLLGARGWYNYNYSDINLASFRAVKELCIDPVLVIKSHHHFDSPNFNQVLSLTLSPSCTGLGWITHFLKRNIVKCDTVKTLKCDHFSVDDDEETDEFVNVLGRFRNINHLMLNTLSVAGDFTAQDVANNCPNINGLSLVDGDVDFNSDLIVSLASKLKYLSLDESNGTGNELRFHNVSFDKLEELKVINPGKRSFGAILKSASRLKKIWLYDGSDLNLKNSISELMVKSEYLKYMVFSVLPDKIDAVLEGIESGLFEIKKQSRMQLKIHIVVQRNSTFKANDFVLNIGRIVNSLETSAIKDFMFIWHLSRRRKSEDYDQLQAVFTKLCKISMDAEVIQHHNRFIIANKNCKINGYSGSMEPIFART